MSVTGIMATVSFASASVEERTRMMIVRVMLKVEVYMMVFCVSWRSWWKELDVVWIVGSDSGHCTLRSSFSISMILSTG